MTLHIEAVGHGEPIVLLHGFALHGGLFDPLVGKLLDRFEVHTIDLPGHGHSPLIAPFDLPNLVREIHAATAHIAAPLTVLGWSFGGMVAQAWALAHPTRIKRLILSCTKPKFGQSEDWPIGTAPQVLQSFVDDFSNAAPATLERFLFTNVTGSDEARAARALVMRSAHARPTVQKEALVSGLKILIQFDARLRLSEITQPTLVVTGGLDRLTQPSIGAFFASALPAAQMLHIARAAHAPHLSHAAEFANAVRAFVDANP